MTVPLRRSTRFSLLAVLLGACGSGCALGPKAIERTHGKYAAAVQRVEEEQFLSNVVRLRYVETPTELAVSSIATQYEVTAGAEARPFFGTESVTGPFFRSFASVLPFAAVGGANRPTVSLTPQTDGTNVRQFLTPISAETVVFLAQSGWPVSSLLRIWVDRLNGVPNWVPASGPPRDAPADYARFRRAAELLQTAQDRELISVHGEDWFKELSGPLPAASITPEAAVAAAKDGFEYRPQKDSQNWVVGKQQRRIVIQVNPAGRGSPELAEFAALTNLTPGRDQYELVVATGVADPGENAYDPVPVLRLTPRSTAQALFYLANGVEVPPEHIACGLVRLPADGTDPTEATAGVFRVRSCAGKKHHPPPCAYAAVWYRDHWYYIDDRDQETKATLLLMLQLRRLDFDRQRVGSIPALTLPVGR